MENLYPHNIEALEKVRKAFLTSNRAAIVHATGTGKSYITAALANDYKKVLVLGPNDYVLEEIRNKNVKADIHTYAWLLTQEIPPSGYDLIVLDEFHRAGAKIWGKSVRDLLDVNPQAKIFGTTATEIRYLDAARNMADELFDGNVVSRLDLPEAWQRGILKIPIYVIGLLNMEKTISNLKQRILISKRLTSQEKTETGKYFNNKTLGWKDSRGVSAILKHHLPADTRRIIVFCNEIDKIEPLRQRFTQWMLDAGFKSTSYVVHSRFNSSFKEMEAFSRNIQEEGVKVLFAVDMLNEGIHVPNVDAVVMLRCTGSRIIHLQQMGRCMCAGDNRQPVIFDLVDNLTRTSEIDNLREQYDARLAPGLSHIHTSSKEKRFTVIDYVSDLRELVASIKALHTNTVDEWLEEARIWFEQNRRRPKQDWENKEEARVATFLSRNRNVPEVMVFRNEMSEKYGFTFPEIKQALPFNERLMQLREFIENEGRWPVHNTADEYEDSLRTFVINTMYRDKNLLVPMIEEMRERFGIELFIRHNVTGNKDIVAKELEEFVHANKRWPSHAGDEKEMKLARKVSNHLHYPPIQQIMSMAETEYGIPKRSQRTKFDEQISNVRKFIKENGRWPGHNNGKAERNLYDFLGRHKNDIRITRLRHECASAAGGDFKMRTCSRLDVEKTIKQLKEFITKNKRWPSFSCETDPKERSLGSFARRQKDNLQIIALKEMTAAQYSVKFISRHDYNETLPLLEAFVKENHHWPRNSKKNPNERYLYNFIRSLKNIGKFEEVEKKLSAETEITVRQFRTKEERLAEVKELITRTGRWPSEAKGDDPSILKFIQVNKDNPEIIQLREQYKKKKAI